MSIFVFDDAEIMYEIPIADITCIRKQDSNRRISFRTVDGEYFAPHTLKQLSEVYAQYGFVQIDKNKLINLNHVNEINGNIISVGGGYDFEVAVRRVKVIKELLSNND